MLIHSMGKFYLVLLVLILPVAVIVLHTNQSTLSKAASQVAVFTTEGSLIKMNGALFNPRGMWNPWVLADSLETNRQTFKELKDVGFNVVLVKISPAAAIAREILDAANQNDLKVILSLQGELFPEAQPAGTEQLISQALTGVSSVKDHPALMGYLLRDEPDYLGDETAEYLRKASQAIRNADPNHLTFTDLAKCEKASVYKNSADVIMHEHHVYVGPIGLIGIVGEPRMDPLDVEYSKQIAGLSDDAACFKKALGNDKPAWAVSFAFGNYSNPDKPEALQTPRGPTPAEYESIFYQWFINGMTGIVPYTFKMGDYWRLPTDSPQLWNKMKELNAEQSRFYQAMVTGEKIPVKVKKPYDTSVQGVITKFNGKTYLMVVNRTPHAISFNLTTAPVNEKSLALKLPLESFEGKFSEVTLTSARPAIKNVKLRQSGSNVVMEWDTDIQATSQVWFSLNYFTNVPGTYSRSAQNDKLTTHHSVVVRLVKGHAYHLRPVSQKDADEAQTRAIGPEWIFTLK